jgi:hypothetical protein
VWDAVGYEGPSVHKGGYVNRGFDDLDWLPDPRIETYTGEPIVEIAKSVPLAPAHGAVHGSGQSTASSSRDTSTQPGATSARQASVEHAGASK